MFACKYVNLKCRCENRVVLERVSEKEEERRERVRGSEMEGEGGRGRQRKREGRE
jgi:hypothetical protein